MRYEEEGMKHPSVYRVPAAARWRTLPIVHKLHWLLRLGVIGCFIGHGAYGCIGFAQKVSLEDAFCAQNRTF